MVTVLLWAAAREAVGSSRVAVDPAPLGQLLAELSKRHPDLARLLPSCRITVDGDRHEIDAAVRDGSTVEVLPPYAGG